MGFLTGELVQQILLTRRIIKLIFRSPSPIRTHSRAFYCDPLSFIALVRYGLKSAPGGHIHPLVQERERVGVGGGKDVKSSQLSRIFPIACKLGSVEVTAHC